MTTATHSGTIMMVDLRKKLKKGGVAIEGWEGNGLGILEDLFYEINSGECVLEEREGKLVRVVSEVGIDVSFQFDPEGDLPGSEYRLVESHQQYLDKAGAPLGMRGREWLEASIVKNIRPGETAEQALERALGEAIGCGDPKRYNRNLLVKTSEVLRQSRSFPGLLSLYKSRMLFACRIKYPAFRMKGYVERRQNKDVHYSWRPALSAKINHPVAA